ncbi:sugar phosphate isomerase/epimerase family protein [Agromyces albus]|uniref:Sugar phosphate isomerase/epimerase n=1 Tax=Agromyces albus TaxID=205332 RepID=A0A4Q2L5Y5_9MICO|nr:sugar phosphate isomerase/epimerase [Agromyces albus]RXZ71822.1 sugar phosphate isomerase/epimerase [Agromyces albus]
MHTSIQLWSLRDDIARDGFGPVIARIADAGYPSVEAFGLVHTVDAVADALVGTGLTVPTVHAELDTEDLGVVADAALRLGAQTVIQHMFPAHRWADDSALDATAAILQRAARQLEPLGLRVAVHHHDDELRTRIGDQPAVHALLQRLDPSIGVQVDINWAAVAGADPIALVRDLGDRVPAVHIKDGPRRGLNTEQTALGRGELDVEGFLAAAPADAVAVLSLDMYQGDAMEAVVASRTWLESKGLDR